MKNKSIVYVNYSPYENSGKMLDFLLENFKYVFMFSIGFHDLGVNNPKNKLLIYIRGKIVEEKPFYHMPVPRSLVFLLLPLRSVLNLFQIFSAISYSTKKYIKIDYFLSVNAFTAWIGLILKKLKLVSTTVFWIWDYYPLKYPDPIVVLMRWLYWQLDKTATFSDCVVYLNNRLVKVRQDAGMILPDKKPLVVPIATNLCRRSERKPLPIRLGFLGVLKKSQGLDLLFDNALDIISKFPSIKIEIVGSGPDEQYFRARAKISPIPCHFHGWLPEDRANKILSKCTIGIAPYLPEERSVAYYGDPGKIKNYLSVCLPVVTTNVFDFSKELETSGAGIIIGYSNPQSLIKAIGEITDNYKKYIECVISLSKCFYYKKLYIKMFN
ncbi:MAG: Glycosyl transferase group 1 [Candidatus Amesbacteria bacterium GW2011_GWA2_47_11b]|uniref:Glycosyl transferase group 1 n=2 Tax=Candidatus Amesiibacteriota TaxID=1752730 RepID=A0A0G1VJT4_9BACT|nr:MAG: Glycosyl transferase group 1 [Candidatus Curtissbacteria bacterium GW2011_GWB1_40_28]KKU29399.1 MAG: Glycosyl transferase group 1 [Microgenomates group bacterium GW2011_GWC1_46_20]KKU58501.1 MAG: Glycosyl transferase group 1 [Candidatus Amesbacteria bacterium GW2011_GWA2_47_11b]KKU70340.1 MAG: Glycosyl transferase group 1 [Candidatus Amesbacteria bacterium GW2011_GWA1_47_20]